MISDLHTHSAKHVRVGEVVDYFGVCRRTVYYWLEKGSLPYIKVGGVIRIRTDDLRDFARPGAARAAS